MIAVGVEMPQAREDGPVPIEELRRALETIDSAGFHSAWVFEPLGTTHSFEPLVELAFAAARTRNVRLGVAVLILPMYQPLRLARMAVTLDRLSEGRLDLGVGVGSAGLAYADYGVSAADRGLRFEAGVETMRRVWSDPEFPKPVQQPLPLWFGASSEPALRRTARLADGWIGAGSAPPDAFRGHVKRLRELLEREGRDPGRFPVAKRIYCSIDQPQSAVDAWLRAMYGSYAFPLDAIADGVGGIEEAVDRYGREGAELVILHPVGERNAQIELLAERVLPLLAT